MTVDSDGVVSRTEMLADINSIGAGAAAEKFAAELAAVLDNIRDPNTEAEGVRKITVTWTFLPQKDRETVMVAIQAKSAMAATKPSGDVMYLGRAEGQTVATVMHGSPADPRQNELVLPIRKGIEP